MLNHLRQILLVLCAVHFLRFWILPAWDSLWIDETGTYWTIAGGWEQLWARTAVHPNSRLYGALMLGWTKLAGTGEIALRLPSLLAMLGALAVLAVFLHRRLGEGAGWPLAALCLASPELSFFALDARPYAFAVLFLALSTAVWYSMSERLTWGRAAAWAGLAGVLVHFHPVVALALSGQAGWMAMRARWNSFTLPRALAWAATLAAAGLIALPEVIRQLPLLTGTNASALPGSVSAGEVARATLPISIYAPALLAAGGLLLFRKWRLVRLDAAARDVAALGISLVVCTAALCSAYSNYSKSTLLLTRYMIAVYPGCFLLVCVLLARWTDESGRRWFALLYSASTLLLSLAAQGWVPVHADADWRGAMAMVRKWEGGRPAPLLMQTGFVEGTYSRYLRDPGLQEFLYAPALYYPHAGATYAIPYQFRPAQAEYREDLVRSVDGRRFAALVYFTGGGTPAELAPLAARHGPPRLVGRVRRLALYAFGPP